MDENFPSINDKNELTDLEDFIASSKEEIEKKSAGTAESWLAQFDARLLALEAQLANKEIEQLVPADKYQLAPMKIEELRYQLAGIKEKYLGKNAPLPLETKQELLEQLDVLKD